MRKKKKEVLNSHRSLLGALFDRRPIQKEGMRPRRRKKKPKIYWENSQACRSKKKKKIVVQGRWERGKKEGRPGKKKTNLLMKEGLVPNHD